MPEGGGRKRSIVLSGVHQIANRYLSASAPLKANLSPISGLMNPHRLWSEATALARPASGHVRVLDAHEVAPNPFCLNP
jgi:hypothetical protein